MPSYELEKVAANQILEATKEVLSSLQKWAHILEQRGEPKPKSLTLTYADARRLRDYFRRVISDQGTTAMLELDEDSCNLVASCCMFFHEEIVKKQQYSQSLRPSDKNWLEEQKRLMAELVNRFASCELKVIPNATGVQALSIDGRNLLGALRERFSDQTAGNQLIAADTIFEVEEKDVRSGFGITRRMPEVSGLESTPIVEDTNSGFGNPRAITIDFAENARQNLSEEGDELAEDGDTEAPAQEQAEQAQQAEQQDKPAQPVAFGETPTYASVAEETKPAKPAKPAKPEPRPLPLDLNLRLLKEPRLRAMVSMDLGSMQRALDANDHRMAAVHLSSVFEGLVVDVALAHKSEYNLRGTPETWRLDDVVRTVMAERYQSSDRATLYHLIACRSLIRPAIQLLNPIVVTKATFEKMLSLADRIAFESGLSGNSESSVQERTDTVTFSDQ